MKCWKKRTNSKGCIWNWGRSGIAGLVANGFGIAVVPYMDILEKMSVEIFEIESPEYERSFYMVNDNSTYMSPAVETFRNFVIENTSVLTAL